PSRHTIADLAADHFGDPSGGPLGLSLADADDWGKPRRQRGPRFASNQFARLPMERAPLGMADDNVTGARISQHGGADLSSAGAVVRDGAAVLGADQHPGSLRRGHGLAHVDGRRANQGVDDGRSTLDAAPERLDFAEAL